VQTKERNYSQLAVRTGMFIDWYNNLSGASVSNTSIVSMFNTNQKPVQSNYAVCKGILIAQLNFSGSLAQTEDKFNPVMPLVKK
jgi:hypothetical protein